MFRKILLFSFVVLFSIFLSAQKGFGFEYDKDIPNVIMVVNVFKNSPAEKSGLQKDDLILAINGDEKVPDYKNEDLRKIIKELPEKGTVFSISRNSKKLNLTMDKAYSTSFEFVLLSGNATSGKCVLGNYSGFRIEGTCKNGMVSGDAKIYDKTNKLLYEGGVINNRRHGFGKEYITSGRFETTYVNGEGEGKGRFYFLDQSYMEATWVNSEIEGTVQYFSADGKPGKTEIYKNNKVVSKSDPSQNMASTTNSTSASSASFEEELQNINAILAKDAGILKMTVKISDGIISTDNGFDSNEAKISDLAEIRIDDKNNEVVLLCKSGPYCVKQNKYVMKEGITFGEVKDFDKQYFAKKMQKILIGLGGKSVNENSLKITTNKSLKIYEQNLDKVNDAMPKSSAMGVVGLRIKDQTLHFSDGMLAYTMNLRDMGKIVVDEKNKTVSLTCKKMDGCVATLVNSENKITFNKFNGTDANGFAKILQNFVNSYVGL